MGHRNHVKMGQYLPQEGEIFGCLFSLVKSIGVSAAVYAAKGSINRQ